MFNRAISPQPVGISVGDAICLDTLGPHAKRSFRSTARWRRRKDVLSDELQQLVRQYTHLGGQRSRSVDVQLPTDPAGPHDQEEQLRSVFDEHTYSFKINMSYGFILRNKQMGRYIYCARFSFPVLPFRKTISSF